MLSTDLREMYEYLQRETTKDRRKGTRRYIEERFRTGGVHGLGAFPAIAVGCTRPLQFETYKSRFPQVDLSEGVGVLQMDLSASTTRILLDGMARVTGALDLIDDERQQLVDFTFPVTIYAPTEGKGDVSIQDLGQIFHDFNFLASPVSRGQAIDLDQSNIYIQMTNALSWAPVIKDAGGMEPRAGSLGAKSTALVAKQVLLRFVRGATEGPVFQEKLRETSVVNPNLRQDNFDETRQRLERFLTNAATEMGNNKWQNRESLHLTAPGWSAMGLAYHDIFVTLRNQLSDTEKDQLARKIGILDWTRWNQDFIGCLGDAAMHDSTGAEIKSRRRKGGPDPARLTEVRDWSGRRKLGNLYGGRRGRTGFIQYIRDRIGLTDRLRAVGVEVAADQDDEKTQGSEAA